MPSVSFHLKRPDSDVPTPVFILFNADGKRPKLYTGINVLPDHWNREEQRAKTGKGFPKVNGYNNAALELMGEKLMEYHAKQRAKGIVPGPKELKEVIEPVKVEEEQENGPPAFLTCYEEWVERCEVTKRPNTIKTYRTTLRHLREFEQHARAVLTFDNLGPAFGDQFPAYLIKQRGLTDAVVKKNITILKTFLNYASDRGLTENLAYKRYSWKHREPDILTLTKGELEAIAALELSASPYLDNARALFLMGCYTGLRYSDIVSLRPEHVYGQTLRLTTTKTSDTLLIPLREEAQALVARMMGNTIHPITNQRLNEYVKEIGKLAGIDRPTERVRYQGGKRQPGLAVPKYELLTCHTARRTFVTQALKDGVRAETVRKTTGHKSLKAFSRYIEVTERDVEEEFAAVYGKKG
jgi:integrase